LEHNQIVWEVIKTWDKEANDKRLLCALRYFYFLVSTTHHYCSFAIWLLFNRCRYVVVIYLLFYLIVILFNCYLSLCFCLLFACYLLVICLLFACYLLVMFLYFFLINKKTTEQTQKDELVNGLPLNASLSNKLK
jgi:prepilin signal peptidase PulO-like enzyme (type II secretory pathway)